MKSTVLLIILLIGSSLFSFESLSKIEVGVKLVPGEAEKVANILINVIKAGRQDFFDSFFNLKNVVYYGSISALFIAISLIGVYSSKLLWNIIEKKLFYSNVKNVRIVNYTDNKYDKIYRRPCGYKIDQMIIDQSIKNYLIEIEERIKQIHTLLIHILVRMSIGSNKCMFIATKKS